MQRASTHSAVRMILAIVGLNGVVIVAWMILQDIVGSAGSLSAGSPESPARLRADLPGAAGMWLDWLAMLAIVGALLVIAAWRIRGPIETSASSGNRPEDASTPDDDVGLQPAGSMRPPGVSSRHVEVYVSR